MPAPAGTKAVQCRCSFVPGLLSYKRCMPGVTAVQHTKRTSNAGDAAYEHDLATVAREGQEEQH